LAQAPHAIFDIEQSVGTLLIGGLEILERQGGTSPFGILVHTRQVCLPIGGLDGQAVRD
jgi:hypothetical protein